MLPENVSSDLEEIGDLEAYVERTITVLVYCSRGYFTSKNCMRELASSVAKKKPIIALIDLDESRGGLSLEAVHDQLIAADGLALKWKFLGMQEASSGAEYQEAHIWPGGEALHAQLFADEPIEWNRISHFQDVMEPLLNLYSLPPLLAVWRHAEESCVALHAFCSLSGHNASHCRAIAGSRLHRQQPPSYVTGKGRSIYDG